MKFSIRKENGTSLIIEIEDGKKYVIDIEEDSVTCVPQNDNSNTSDQEEVRSLLDGDQIFR